MGLREDFTALVRRGTLDRGALAIARVGHPDLDPAPSLATLDRLAAEAEPRVVRAGTPEAGARALAAYLFEEGGFRGNQDDYYDPSNSFLNEVLERRTGIPITLSVVLIEIGRRLGLPLIGIGFPGHFLVGLEGTNEPLLLDPFFGGEVEPQALLERYCAVTKSAAIAVPPDALDIADTPAILARMLRNLVRIYLDRRDPTHALPAVDLLLVLMPDAPPELRLRGVLYDTLECFTPALADLRRYLELVPDAPDADDVRSRITRLARAAEAIH